MSTSFADYGRKSKKWEDCHEENEERAWGPKAPHRVPPEYDCHSRRDSLGKFTEDFARTQGDQFGVA